jgi:Putative prokaryotic signal transducing protein
MAMDELTTNAGLDPEQFVTVARFIEPVEAQMAKGVLESADLECFLQGENANNLLGAAFRARLLVHRRDEAAARELLSTPAGEGDASAAEAEASDNEE